ncbi:alpha/beta fold hydrolase [Bacillus sp. CGMCC 1.16607]|uniref:alpha/beta fold hydrolase n=1 Tax=Bacillus sp. CGMCC 1.16607 TaxID=3351842 RepID=UPI00362D9A82
MLKWLFGGYIKPVTDQNGKVIPNSVAELEKIKIGGVDQWITIKGKSKDMPILLFLHGGPGSPQTGAQRKYNAELEEHYIVVNWDQRGSGKSFSKEISPESMNVNQILSDANELVHYLLRRFGQKKLFIMGQSVGAAYGLLFTSRHPELIHAFIGINQPVLRKEEEIRSYQFTLETARKNQNQKAIRQLEAIHLPENGIYRDVNHLVTQRTWLTKFNGVTYEKNAASINVNYLLSSHLTLKEKIKFMKGFQFSSTHLWNEITSLNFFELVPEVKVPVYFIAGKHDRIVFMDLVQEYYRFLKAPKKELIVFDKSGHLACFEENVAFNLLMVKVKIENYPLDRRESIAANE